MLEYDVHGVHYEISSTTRKFLETKMQRFAKYQAIVQSLHFTIKQTHHKDRVEYKVSVHTHVRSHGDVHLEQQADQLYPAIELVLDHLDEKLRREKEKIQNHTA